MTAVLKPKGDSWDATVAHVSSDPSLGSVPGPVGVGPAVEEMAMASNDMGIATPPNSSTPPPSTKSPDNDTDIIMPTPITPAVPTVYEPKIIQTPFIHKLYNMLEDKTIENLISWTPSGQSFVMQPSHDFSKVLARYFKHTNISSFVRQLNMYGFQKVDDVFQQDTPDAAMWEFKHGGGNFKRGDLVALREINKQASRHALVHRVHHSQKPPPLPLLQRGTPLEPMSPTLGGDAGGRDNVQQSLYGLKNRLVRVEHTISELNICLQNHDSLFKYPSEEAGPKQPTTITAKQSEKEDDVQVGLDDDTESRTPSPWQVADSPEARLALMRSFWLVGNGLEDESQFSQNTSNASESPEAAMEVDISASSDSGFHDDGMDDTCEAESGGSSSQNGGTVDDSGTGPGLAQLPTTTLGGRQNRKRPQDSDDPDRDRGDDDDDAPSRKRWQTQPPDRPLTRPRLACPYQKYDPVGSPFCCMPNQKNREGGADTFPRIKAHIFRNHDPYTRCPNCWKACKTEKEAQEHQPATECVQTASPGKYWMTREQQRQVRGRRFVGNSVENWFNLFGLLLPQVPAHGPGGYKALSPYYVPTVNGQHGPPTPPPNFGASGSGKQATGILASNSNMSFEVNPSPAPSSEPQQPPDLFPPPVNLYSDGPTLGDFVPCLTGFQNELDTEIDSLLNSSGFQGSAFDNHATSTPPSLDSNSVQFYNLPCGSSTTTPFPRYPQTTPLGIAEASSTLTELSSSEKFLHQDNVRLNSSNGLLRDEIASLRRSSEAKQARLNQARDQLQPLNETLQKLLYLPEVRQSGIERLMNGLFVAMRQVNSMERVLIGCGEG